MCKGETASITGANRSEQSNFFQICEQCRHKGATVCTTVIKVNLFSFLMMSLHWYWFPQAKLPSGYFKIKIASIQRCWKKTRASKPGGQARIGIVIFSAKLSVGFLCYNNSAGLAKTNTGASKPGWQARTGIGFCKQSYWLSQEDKLALVLVFARKSFSK